VIMWILIAYSCISENASPPQPPINEYVKDTTYLMCDLIYESNKYHNPNVFYEHLSVIKVKTSSHAQCLL